MKHEIDQLKMGQILLEKKINDIVLVQNKESTEPASTETQQEKQEGSDSNSPSPFPASNFDAPNIHTNINNDIDDTDLTHRIVTLSKGKNGLFGFNQMFDCVYSVTPGSSADLNGLRRGDQLISIDGVKFEGWTRTIYEIMQTRDTVTIEVRYNPKHLDAEERRTLYFILACIPVLIVIFVAALFT